MFTARNHRTKSVVRTTYRPSQYDLTLPYMILAIPYSTIKQNILVASFEREASGFIVIVTHIQKEHKTLINQYKSCILNIFRKFLE